MWRTLTTAFVCGFPVGAKISNTNIAIKTVRKQQRSLLHSGIHFFQTAIFFSRRRHVGIKRGHLAMLTLDQLPFQAEGYRSISCIPWHIVPGRRRGRGLLKEYIKQPYIIIKYKVIEIMIGIDEIVE